MADYLDAGDVIGLVRVGEDGLRLAVVGDEPDAWAVLLPPDTNAPGKSPIPCAEVVALLRNLQSAAVVCDDYAPGGAVYRCCGPIRAGQDGHADNCPVVAFCGRYGLDLSEVQDG